MENIGNTYASFYLIRHDRLLREAEHDSYKTKGKLPEPTVCPGCGAVFHEGRWQWGEIGKKMNREMCPACHRLHDHYPAGFITMEGPFFLQHRDEIMRLVRNEEKREKQEHPLKRIMEIEEEDGAMRVTTTDIHLARGIGEAVCHAYQGELEFHYNPDENLLRVHWTH